MDYAFSLPSAGEPTKEDWGKVFLRAKALREAGAEFAAVHVSWAVVERAPGQWHFGFYRRYFQTLVEAGLLIQPVLGQSPHGGGVSIPDWYYEQYPDARFINEFGQADINDSGRACFPSFWHAETLPRFEQYLRQTKSELLDGFLDHTASYHVTFPGPYGEASYPGAMPVQEEARGAWGLHEITGDHFWCYDPNARRDFAATMRRKYGSDLARLNKAWQTGYGDWNEIEPPKPDMLPNNVAGRQHWADLLEWYRFTFRNFFGYALDLARVALPSDKLIFIYSGAPKFEILQAEVDKKWRAAIASRGGEPGVRECLDELWKMSQLEARWQRGEQFGVIVSSCMPGRIEFWQRLLLGGVDIAQVHSQLGYHFPLYGENMVYWEVPYMNERENILETAHFVTSQGYSGYRFFWDRWLFDPADGVSPNQRARWLREAFARVVAR